MKLGNKKKVALCLGGGGIKAAAFHVGTCLALQEKGFLFLGGSPESVERQIKASPDKTPVRTYVGSSAGAIIATLLAAGYSIEALIHSFQMESDLKTAVPESGGYLRPLTYKDIFQINGSSLANYLPQNFMNKPSMVGGIEVLLKGGFKVNGMFNTTGIEKYLREDTLPFNRFDQLGVELYIATTQLNHTRKVIFGNFPETQKHPHIKWANYASISEAVAASASLPPVFAPYPIQQHDGKEIYFIDGEIRDTLSSHVAEDTGADLVIASYSLQPYHYTEEIGSLHTYGVPVILNQALYQLVHQKISRFRREKEKYRDMASHIETFFKENGLPEKYGRELTDFFCEKFEHRQEVDYIYLHPIPQNYELFFLDHFSLNPKVLGKIVKLGFLSAVRCLREYDI